MEFIERLDFSESTDYSALESSIHLGRYLLAKQYCEGKRILDIACGEGYGSFAMADRWGAKEVFGVDVSEDAIILANQNFKRSNTHFQTMNAELDTDFFEEGYFDMIVSFETIEHLKNPQAYLMNIKKWLKADGIILISCPNDNWYYGSSEEANPFHERKYTFEEFQTLCESVLGASRGYMYGLPINGFSNVSIHDTLIVGNENDNMDNMFNYKSPEGVMVPTSYNITPDNVSYFVGIWGPMEIGIENTSCFYGTSMDETRIVPFSDYVKIKESITKHDAEVCNLKKEIKDLAKLIQDLKKSERALISENKKLSLTVKGTNRENQFLRENLTAAQNWNKNGFSDSRVNELTEELHTLLNSKSWRITAPLRTLFNWFRR